MALVVSFFDETRGVGLSEKIARRCVTRFSVSHTYVPRFPCSRRCGASEPTVAGSVSPSRQCLGRAGGCPPGLTKPRKNTAIRSSSIASLYRLGEVMGDMAVPVSEKGGRERRQRMAEMAGPAGTWLCGHRKTSRVWWDFRAFWSPRAVAMGLRRSSTAGGVLTGCTWSRSGHRCGGFWSKSAPGQCLTRRGTGKEVVSVWGWRRMDPTGPGDRS